MDRIEIEGNLEYIDVLRAAFWFYYRYHVVRHLVLWTSIVAVSLFLYRGNVEPALVFVGILAAIAFVLQFVVVSFWAKRQVASSVLLREHTKYAITPEGLEVETSSSSGRVEWSAFHQIRETRGSFLLFQSATSYTILPKWMFRGREKLAAFRALVREQLGERALLQGNA